MRIDIGLAYRPDKAIAPSGHRLDAAALFTVLIEDAAQRRNLNRQVAFPDHRPRPDGFHNRVLRYQLSLVLD